MNLYDSSKNALVRKKCIELIPQLYKHLKEHFDHRKLTNAMKAIFTYINDKKNQDRGQGFVSLGRMSTLVNPAFFSHELDNIVAILSKEIVPPTRTRDGMVRPNINLDSLTCIKMLLKNFGSQLADRLDINKLINDMFYSGYNK